MSYAVRKTKHLLEVFIRNFTNDLYEIKIKWIIKIMRNLVHLRSINLHPACVIYEGICTCKENHIGKNIQTLTKYLNHLDI